MRVAAIQSLHADAGQRVFDFLKITTDDGLVGRSEYNESAARTGCSGARRCSCRHPELNADRPVLAAIRDHAMEPFELLSVEIDTRSPEALAYIPRSAPWTWPSSTRRGTGWRSP